jgi:hypothetical protein
MPTVSLLMSAPAAIPKNETSYIAKKPNDIDIYKSCLTANCEQEYGSACLEKFRQNRL